MRTEGVGGLAALLLLASCGKPLPPPEVIRTVEVAVPVKQKCVPDTFDPVPPIYPDTDAALKIGDAADRYLLLGAGRPLRIARLNELETVVAGCR